MEMSITRALNEIKLLEKRINDKIINLSLIKANKKSNKSINGQIIEEFNAKAKADYQSVLDLMARRDLIKKLIDESNATTEIKLNDVSMTVLEAINKKHSIEFKKNLLVILEKQYKMELAKCENSNDLMESNLDNQITAMLGSDNKKNDGIEVFSKTYREQNGYELINPLNLQNKIELLREEIDEFENNIDFLLSESNSITKIEIGD